MPKSDNAGKLRFLDELRAIVGRENVLSGSSEQAAYESDAYPLEKACPLCAVLPKTSDEVIEVVRACNASHIPFSPRGAGTGLAGGTLIRDGVSIGLARMNEITEIDIRNRRITAEAGVVNIMLSKAVKSDGMHFAPDPSSQGACTIGGNIANNAGGPHTLKYGVTVNHLMAADVVLPSGDAITLGDKTEETGGYDLLSLVCGGEGTLGIVTKATLRLTGLPQAVETLLAIFGSIGEASAAVSGILAAGITPAALEMLDRQVIEAVEGAFHYGFPLDAAAVLIIEVDGLSVGIKRQAQQVRSVCQSNGATEIRQASDAADRARLWSARKKAIGTLGRLAPGIVTQDGVIPRSKLPDVLAKIAVIGKANNLRIANVFHAGDGNLHPAVLFDPAVPGELDRVHKANQEILRLCLASGGTLTGEHGVGVEKRDFMPMLFPKSSLDMMSAIRSCFNPLGICNPGKVLPIDHGCSYELAQRISGSAA
jgi:glycolate oxidase subunit GlcD